MGELVWVNVLQSSREDNESFAVISSLPARLRSRISAHLGRGREMIEDRKGRITDHGVPAGSQREVG
jgi:hypothetical protein